MKGSGQLWRKPIGTLISITSTELAPIHFEIGHKSGFRQQRIMHHKHPRSIKYPGDTPRSSLCVQLNSTYSSEAEFFGLIVYTLATFYIITWLLKQECCWPGTAFMIQRGVHAMIVLNANTYAKYHLLPTLSHRDSTT